ncbi:hypothetical protein J1N35_020972 [Gossypium stocksii]|uniref:Uncharacterized protein n=1 Tax=Gossypium stocksii TaxID=47602 RepID=A0A9D3VEA9_9ROSI|nr:hypothetical protein J1N35_020972 [Gossypium stocksii]
MMGPESTSSSTPSPNGKRSRDPEDEVYLDNLRSHKRYLSEIMASSLNGLTVGDPLPEYLLESPARSEGMFYPGLLVLSSLFYPSISSFYGFDFRTFSIINQS